MEIENSKIFIAVREVWIEELEIAIDRHADHIKRDKAEMARYKKEIAEAKELRVRVFTKPLSPEEIEDLYKEERTAFDIKEA